MKLIVGLGNPGDKYKKTRHNAGFMAADKLAEHFGMEEFKSLDKGKSLMTKGEIAGEKVILIKPQSYMNLSGIPTAAVASYFKIDRKDIIAIYDDADIESGTLRVRQEGSAAGHNGVKSLIEELGGDDFVRIRLGIKPEKPFPGALEDYVLGKLTKDEQSVLTRVLDQLPEVIEKVIKEA
ncbi:aminoacyl-tRNA hydrolase [Candidatus Peregrinibacteria bacterium]|nr:aminoacyl-tRNA hydrolase [Candidatus Peregrinibacteria bacterium]